MTRFRAILLVIALLMPLVQRGIEWSSRSPVSVSAPCAVSFDGAEEDDSTACDCCAKGAAKCLCCVEDPGPAPSPAPVGVSLTTSVRDILRLAPVGERVEFVSIEVVMPREVRPAAWSVRSIQSGGSAQSWLCVRTT